MIGGIPDTNHMIPIGADLSQSFISVANGARSVLEACKKCVYVQSN
jgi:hypothetical protein